MVGTALHPTTNDGLALGTTSLKWSDLYLADGAYIDFNNGDISVIGGGNLLQFRYATNGYRFDYAVSPVANDGCALGASSLAWSDLFLASGGVINFDAGDVTLTHGANALTLSGSNSFTVEDAATGRNIRFTSGNLLPLTSNVSVLGGPSNQWADLYLGSGAVINFNNGDVTIQHDTDRLYFRNAATRYTFDNTVAPESNDAGALGISTAGWSDLYLASGGVINWNASDVTLTHAAGKLTGAGGNFAFGDGAIATTATDGFLYVPTCAGTPTGTPTTVTGYAPIIVDTTNNKLYFYSGAAWRDAGP